MTVVVGVTKTESIKYREKKCSEVLHLYSHQPKVTLYDAYVFDTEKLMDYKFLRALPLCY